jgi:hypothetical protein
VKFAISVLALAAACFAQESLTIDNEHEQRVSTPEAEKIYFSACSVVGEEFDVQRLILPRVRVEAFPGAEAANRRRDPPYLGRVDQDQFVPGRPQAAFPVGWVQKRGRNIR